MIEKITRIHTSEPSMAEKEVANLEYLRNHCSYNLSNKEFDLIYSPLRQQIGINSPAVMLFPKMAQALGVNKVLGDEAIRRIVIAINKDILPDVKYEDYLLEHECWEVYIKLKEGFNLNSADIADSKLSFLERKRPAHRYSCYREFLLAAKDNKEDEYLEWWKNFYQQDRERVEQMSDLELASLRPVYGQVDDLKLEIKKLIDNNQGIKEWACQKVKSGLEEKFTMNATTEAEFNG
jgi:hypothetical protein